MARYSPSQECLDAASKAAGGVLGREDLHSTFERVSDIRDNLAADGKVDGMNERLRDAVQQEADRTRIAAALQRKQAALNVIVRDRLTTSIDAFRAQGLTPRKAILAILEGTQQGVKDGRVSVAASRLAFEGRYVGDLFGQIAKDRPYLLDVITEKQLNDDVAREMAELKEGGKPGRTGNKDAEYLAKTFATYAEMSRTDLNKRGASIGKLDGWSGAQVHDDLKMIAAGKDAWTTSVLPKLDIARTFPDAQSPAEIVHYLGEIYDTLITGIDNKAAKDVTAGRVNPANLAKSLGKSRVLHFKGADEALAYQGEFGYGNTISGMMAHQRKAARLAAAMDRLGPNPEAMMRSVIDRAQKDIRNDPKLSDAEKKAELKGLDYDNVAGAMDIATGLAARPVSPGMAKLGNEIRASVGMAKLGGAVLTAMPTDTATAGAASMFRGGGFFHGLMGQIAGIMKGRPKGEQREISYMLNEGFEGVNGHILSQSSDALDSSMGPMSRLAETYFKWNRLTWWDEVSRSVNARMVSAEMGMRAKAAFADLPPKYRHVLELNGIHEPEWQAIRQAQFRADNGNDYVMPDSMRGLPDTAVSHLAASDIAAAHADLASRTAARQAKTDTEGEWVQKRALRLAAKMGREEARLEDRIKTLKGDAAAEVTGLRDKVTALKDLFARINDGSETQFGAGHVQATHAKVESRIQDIKSAMARTGKDKAASMLASWVRREGDLQEFTDRMGRYAKAREAAGAADVAAHAGRIAEIHDSKRFDLEMAVRRFVSDEVRYGILQTDAQSRRFTNLGTRPGTLAGEAMRFMSQFKGFPIAFTSRIVGRALFGGTGATKGARALNNLPHIGSLLAGLTVAGYMSMVMKSTMSGKTPQMPRDKKEALALFFAAMKQGGGAGIYGDYLFSAVNRFGNTPVETFAGPTVTTIGDLISLFLKARNGEAKAGNALNTLVNTTPFANLFYVRPALDFLFLNSLREAASPGYLKRQERTLQTTTGQSYMIPRRLGH